jgi:phosphoheptose isomerase
MTIGLAALAVAISVPSAAHASPEPVRIGILDMQASRIADSDANVRIVHRTFLGDGDVAAGVRTPSGMDHGMVVATSAVRAVRSLDRSVPIEIYSANTFRMSPDGRGYSMRYEKAMEALDWMHSKGVRVVVTSFNTKNMGGAVSLMNRAENLGMTVVAGASNVAGAGKVWPAADVRAISVADTMPSGSSLTLDPTVQQWVKFGFRGDYADMSKGGVVEDWGSSYSSAKVGGIAAYYVSRNPQAGRDEIEGSLRSVSRTQVQKYGRVKAVVAAIDAGGWENRMKTLISGSAATESGVSLLAHTGSKGPRMAGIEDAMSRLPAVFTGTMDR